MRLQRDRDVLLSWSGNEPLRAKDLILVLPVRAGAGSPAHALLQQMQVVLQMGEGEPLVNPEGAINNPEICLVQRQYPDTGPANIGFMPVHDLSEPLSFEDMVVIGAMSVLVTRRWRADKIGVVLSMEPKSERRRREFVIPTWLGALIAADIVGTRRVLRTMPPVDFRIFLKQEGQVTRNTSPELVAGFQETVWSAYARVASQAGLPSDPEPLTMPDGPTDMVLRSIIAGILDRFELRHLAQGD